ncbi:hypothetical protein MFIFM68171_04498 [Madurella fahalii]|uniref:Rho-GAP domain-containing protein n=1 Tax=Madurella fahalii TaxID=1157608 RepID=A0ABQ0G943_9PEZI
MADASDIGNTRVRGEFVQEYNLLAREHGIPVFVPDNNSPSPVNHPSQQRGNWFIRKFLRRESTAGNASSTRPDKKAKTGHRVSDLAMHLISGAKRDSLRDEDLQSLVRLCGKSMVYLPSEYAVGPLVLPTCFRATAQYLVQHGADARGVFRIPGSVRVVNALYNYYCADGNADEITNTTRCPNLPAHIKAGIHDVASTFKRLLSGLPGGILGSRSLFDALASIHNQLTETDDTELRARLIALAVGSIGSKLRRELICAVFGLLSLIRHTVETAPREDKHEKPLLMPDMMGYNALGIVFGPLLIGDDIDSCTVGGTNDTAESAPLLAPPPNKWKLRWKGKIPEDVHSGTLSVDKVHMVDNIAEMLITHWRDIVKQMRSLGVLEQ